MRIRFIIAALFFLGCEDVIEVDAPAEPPRLIIDALIRIDASQQFQNVRVRVGLSDSFFGEIPATELQDITIINVDMESTFENPNYIVLLETEPGIYEASKNTAFFISGQLVFQLTHGEQRYLARTRYVPAVPIDRLEQGTQTLFDEDDTEIIVAFTDEDSRDDFYLFDFDFGNFLVTEDEFYQGQPFSFSYFYDENLAPGHQLEISIMGSDEAFYNYMGLLIEQSGQDDFGPFETPVASVRGNIINVTEIDNIDFFDNVDSPDNFALGYFAVVQEFKDSITIEE